MDDKKKLAIIGGYLTIFDEDQKKRRVWSKRWYLERQKYSHNLKLENRLINIISYGWTKSRLKLYWRLFDSKFFDEFLISRIFHMLI
nr:unnamed protein product [Callosobruchus chinensis]